MKNTFIIISLMIILSSCSSTIKPFTGEKGEVKIITLNPGHFHAALVQKKMYTQIDSTVFVYSAEGDDLTAHLNRISGYNNQPENPTHWNEMVYTGNDFFEKMIAEKKGNLVVIAGNNQLKTDYILSSVQAGLNVLADKPMAINTNAFEKLLDAFKMAEQKKILLYDIMTERFEITNILQKEFSQIIAIFGTLEKGTLENPSVIKESVHHFNKMVSGVALKRPAWFFDVKQEGEGIVDVNTHLVDLVQWECFPNQMIDYKKDISVDKASHWPTAISHQQFNEVTGLSNFPDFLKEYVIDSMLNVFANGEIHYTIKGVHAKVSVLWNYKAPEGGGDTHFSIMKGTKANLIIKQGAEQQFKPTLYIEPIAGTDTLAFAKILNTECKKLAEKFEGISLKKTGEIWEVVISEKYKTGHESHFGQVTEKYLQYLVDGKLPDWEIPNMIAKYYTTTKALEMAKPK